MNEKPGEVIPCTMISASPFGSPVKPRAMKFAPAASAMAIGWNSVRPVPCGASLEVQCVSVVGEGWPLVMP